VGIGRKLNVILRSINIRAAGVAYHDNFVTNRKQVPNNVKGWSTDYGSSPCALKSQSRFSQISTQKTSSILLCRPAYCGLQMRTGALEKEVGKPRQRSPRTVPWCENSRSATPHVRRAVRWAY